MSNFTGLLNGPSGSKTMLTWYQGNFTEVLNRLAGTEAMLVKKRGEEHTLDSSYKIQLMAPGNTENSQVLDG